MSKKVSAKDWHSRPIEEWNVTTFHAYMIDRHKELFGVDYAPFRSWRLEQGLIGGIVGTQKKEGTHDKALIKDFIDETFETYEPTPEYPGTSFGFMWTYRQNVLQKIQWRRSQKEKDAEYQMKEKERLEQFQSLNDNQEIDALEEWF